MESLEALQGQLDTLHELRTIVRTMKSLSTASIRQYEQAVVALSGYARTVELGLQGVLRTLPPPSVPAASSRPSASLGAIVFGSDHGLCGRFNEEIADHARRRLDALAPDPGHHRLLAVGARAADSLERLDQACETSLSLPGSAARITQTVQTLLERVDAWEGEGIQRVWLFHHRPAGGGRYEPVVRRLLPVDLRRFSRAESPTWPSRRLPTCHQAPEILLSRLVGQYLFVTLFRACAESLASEHASRRSAMQAAQRNLDERLDDVTQNFRRARQAAITAELLDVVGGFEVIRGDG
ncbi:F0F1 ATP synthase subunit gamma [Halomonas organivorans]